MADLERTRKTPEPRFDASRNLVVFSGTAKQVQKLYTSILKVKYPDKKEAEIGYLSNEAIANIDGEHEYQYTFGITERVRVYRDRFGDYGKRDKIVLLYMPNSPADAREEADTIQRIKSNMEKLGFRL